MSTAITEMMQSIGQAARAASRAMARASTEQKNQVLLHIARLVREQSARIIETNAVDVERAKKSGHDAAFIDRLTMTAKTVESMALGLEQIATLELLTTLESLPVKIIISKSDLSNGEGAPVIAMALYGMDTEPRNLKPQAEVKKAGKTINAPSQVRRSKLGIWLLPFAPGFTAGSFCLELMMAPLFC